MHLPRDGRKLAFCILREIRGCTAPEGALREADRDAGMQRSRNRAALEELGMAPPRDRTSRCYFLAKLRSARDRSHISRDDDCRGTRDMS